MCVRKLVHFVVVLLSGGERNLSRDYTQTVVVVTCSSLSLSLLSVVGLLNQHHRPQSVRLSVVYFWVAGTVPASSLTKIVLFAFSSWRDL